MIARDFDGSAGDYIGLYVIVCTRDTDNPAGACQRHLGAVAFQLDWFSITLDRLFRAGGRIVGDAA
jgi:hypothetical protein